MYASDNYYERVDFWGTVSWQKNGMVIALSDVAEATKAGQTVTTVPIRKIVDEVASPQEQKMDFSRATHPAVQSGCRGI